MRGSKLKEVWSRRIRHSNLRGCCSNDSWWLWNGNLPMGPLQHRQCNPHQPEDLPARGAQMKCRSTFGCHCPCQALLLTLGTKPDLQAHVLLYGRCAISAHPQGASDCHLPLSKCPDAGAFDDARHTDKLCVGPAETVIWNIQLCVRLWHCHRTCVFHPPHAGLETHTTHVGRH